MEKCQKNQNRELAAFSRKRDRDVKIAKVKYLFIGLCVGVIIGAIIWWFV